MPVSTTREAYLPLLVWIKNGDGPTTMLHHLGISHNMGIPYI